MIQEWGSCVSPEGVATLNCIPIVIQNLVNALIIIAGVVCVFLIIWAGYKFVMSEGDPEKVSMARKTFVYALVGFLFILMSFFFLNVIAEFTGVEKLAPETGDRQCINGSVVKCPDGTQLCPEEITPDLNCDMFQ